MALNCNNVPREKTINLLILSVNGTIPDSGIKMQEEEIWNLSIRGFTTYSSTICFQVVIMQILTLKGREFCIRNKTTYMGKGESSVYGTKPRNKGK